MSEYNFSNKDLFIFFAVTFGLTIGMGIVMGFAYTKYPLDSFTLTQAYYPSIGVMTALLLNKERRKNLPMKFYGTYLFFTITSILVLLIDIYVLHKDPNAYMNMVWVIGSITLCLVYFADKKEKIYDFGLGLGKNVKASIGYILLFVVLCICGNFLSALTLGNGKKFIDAFINTKRSTGLIYFPSLCIAFLGEEYGWRYFLQPALQQRIGKRKGVILLGIIWGIWHLPINLFYYSPMTPFYSILNQLIICISYSIFFGFVYMKTENIWTVSIIHCVNNGILPILNNAVGINVVLNGKLVLANLICFCVVYLPFLFTKEYRKDEREVEFTNKL
ncbi:CPBP family intramembrane glutamic endopeptidase [Clostridium lundense]|uniref:CPBP family intramembrane glutamic endopeptidase n=1 Tax=Clostridium lundense TaxID=319475 RepID=UPI0004825A28|nr:type II CAAX endopeptidase family protein [Clostridium lundense]